MNAVYTGETARLLSNIDISVAVATDNGLITPIVKDALWLGVEEISVCVKVRCLLSSFWGLSFVYRLVNLFILGFSG